MAKIPDKFTYPFCYSPNPFPRALPRNPAAPGLAVLLTQDTASAGRLQAAFYHD